MEETQKDKNRAREGDVKKGKNKKICRYERDYLTIGLSIKQTDRQTDKTYIQIDRQRD